MENLAEAICNHHEIDISDPSLPSQSEISTVGRICCDSEGKLNPESVILESLPYFGGKRVKLAINNLSSYALFPGQIVGIQGTNNFGSEINVSKILEVPRLPMCRTSPNIIKDYYGPTKLNGRPLNVFEGTGCAKNYNIDCKMGPFVDEDHSLIQAGEMDMTPGEIFARKINPMLYAFTRSTPTVKVVMIPSIKDVFHNHIAFPQPPFGRSGIVEGITCLSNPVQFRVNEIVFAISNIDVLCHLFQDETEKDSEYRCFFDITLHRDFCNRQMLIIGHIFSLYPLFPPSAGANLDLKHWSSLDLLYTPDVLVLPSKLKYFAKVIDKVICINPGYLAKGSNTYIKMTIHPPPQSIEGEAEAEHLVHQRTRVDIIRI
ncbi:13524_t:CDS:2 [Acaulospora colombiana]|uniref:13524_t:CDS:1 n=1 Tax=Acaulospora colombiana TaxID=27376 RepID=A0ACA9K8C4_9GLOM|nr:13524_t:CDS:2 [Acaulospora colombiana]